MGDQVLNICEYSCKGVEAFEVIVSGEIHGILSISQKLNLIENIYKKIKKFETHAHQH